MRVCQSCLDMYAQDKYTHVYNILRHTHTHTIAYIHTHHAQDTSTRTYILTHAADKDIRKEDTQHPHKRSAHHWHWQIHAHANKYIHTYTMSCTHTHIHTHARTHPLKHSPTPTSSIICAWNFLYDITHCKHKKNLHGLKSLTKSGAKAADAHAQKLARLHKRPTYANIYA